MVSVLRYLAFDVHNRCFRCYITNLSPSQVSPTTIILSGGSAHQSGGAEATAAVSELSNLSNEAYTRQLPNHLNSRYWHACSWYMQGQSQVRGKYNKGRELI